MPTVTEEKPDAGRAGEVGIRRSSAGTRRPWSSTSTARWPTWPGSSGSSSRRSATGSARSGSTGASARGSTTEDTRGERQAPPGGEAPDHGARPAQTKCGLLGEGVGPVSRYRHVSAMKAEGFPDRSGLCRRPRSPPRPTTTGWPALGRPDRRRVGRGRSSSTRCNDIHADPDDTYGSPRG